MLWRAHRARAAAATEEPQVGADTAALARRLLDRGDELASVLSAAIQLRTISFETRAGTPASLLPPSGSKGRPPPVERRGGCACCGVSAPVEGGGNATIATPVALDESRRALLGFHTLLRASFPLTHACLELTVINTYSLVYVWRGHSSGGEKPIALAAHLDVVPAPDAHEWAHPPFSGAIDAGYVHGRGAIDDKHAVVSIMGAVEELLKAGWSPSRTVCLLFGHDEEVGGLDGAASIAAALPRLLDGARLEFVLDEGQLVPIALACLCAAASLLLTRIAYIDAIVPVSLSEPLAFTQPPHPTHIPPQGSSS